MKVQKSNQISNIGRFLDQPNLLKGLNKTMPFVLVGGALAVGANDVYKSSDKQKDKSIIRNVTTLGAVVGSSLLMVKGLKIKGKKVFKGLIDAHSHEHSHHHKPQEKLTDAIDRYAKSVDNKNIKKILEKSKKKILSLKEITDLKNHTSQTKEGDDLFKRILPEPHEHGDSKHIFDEMKRLSLIGLIPVAGGIAGGTVGDALTCKNWKEKFPNKVKEGAYQYLANIFLCNVGAGAALWGVETLAKKNILKTPPSTATKVGAMVGGVLTVGVLGGSAIANFLGQKIINPMFHKKIDGDLYHERTPDPLDVSLHVDDMASIGVLSGFKWVEPALPLLYSVSGYRAGIGYRNHGHHKNDHKQHYKKYKHKHYDKKNINFEHSHRVNNDIFKPFIEKEKICQSYPQA